MLYIEDLKRTIVSKLRDKGFSFGSRDKDNNIKFPYIELSIDNDTEDNCKGNVFHEVTINVEIIANGHDELKAKINDLQQAVMRALHSEYKGVEHYIEFAGFDIIQYIDEDDEKYNIYRRIIPCRYIIQTNNF